MSILKTFENPDLEAKATIMRAFRSWIVRIEPLTTEMRAAVANLEPVEDSHFRSPEQAERYARLVLGLS